MIFIVYVYLSTCLLFAISFVSIHLNKQAECDFYEHFYWWSSFLKESEINKNGGEGKIYAPDAKTAC